MTADGMISSCILIKKKKIAACVKIFVYVR